MVGWLSLHYFRGNLRSRGEHAIYHRRRHGAAGSRSWMWDDGRAQGGGAIWRHGGVEGTLERSMHWSLLDMGSRKTEVATSTVCTLVHAEGLLDRLCFLLANRWFGEDFRFLDDVHWCDIRHWPCSWLPPSSVGVAMLIGWWLRVDICISLLSLCSII
jgi:hypothetical protein